jgi:hypothetical protein
MRGSGALDSWSGCWDAEALDDVTRNIAGERCYQSHCIMSAFCVAGEKTMPHRARRRSSPRRAVYEPKQILV